MLKRFVYLGYYLKNLDKEKFSLFFNHVRKQNGTTFLALISDVIWASLKYNISLLEYFQFRFYDKNTDKRKTYAGTGYMYEYQLVMNPKSSRQVLDDKILFFTKYNSFIKHLTADINSLRNDEVLLDNMLSNSSGKIVLKYSHGQCGWQVGIYETRFFRDNDLVAFMEEKGFDMAEEFIVQQSTLMDLSPSGVNTVRIVTQLNNDNDVEILATRLRISENSPVDNMAAGNFAAPIDVKTGKVYGPGVYGDITKKDVAIHPITKTPVTGFQVPYWDEIINMVKQAALLIPENRSIGWDVAVSESGPELIEGNHDWCKLVWQLPVHKGMKAELDRYLDEYQKKTV